MSQQDYLLDQTNSQHVNERATPVSARSSAWNDVSPSMSQQSYWNDDSASVSQQDYSLDQTNCRHVDERATPVSARSSAWNDVSTSMSQQGYWNDVSTSMSRQDHSLEQANSQHVDEHARPVLPDFKPRRRRRRIESLPPVHVADPNDVKAVRRARNTQAKRISREKRAIEDQALRQQVQFLQARVNDLEAQVRWYRARFGYDEDPSSSALPSSSSTD
ncbi:hypothetical protein ACLMJK_006488 [Lecanora helva]